MVAEGTKSRLRAFVLQSLRHNQLADDDDIFEVGGASSLFAMELVLFIEETFAIALHDSDLERENFRSIDALVALVDWRRNEPE